MVATGKGTYCLMTRVSAWENEKSSADGWWW